MNKIQENLEVAKSILQEYENTTELTRVLQLYKRLSIYSVFLWENLSQLKKQYNTSYYTRKIEVSKSYLNNKKDKITDKKAVSLADIENEELYIQESQNEALALRLDIFLKQINKVLMAMSSDVSYLKNEQNRTKSSDL